MIVGIELLRHVMKNNQGILKNNDGRYSVEYRIPECLPKYRRGDVGAVDAKKYIEKNKLKHKEEWRL